MYFDSLVKEFVGSYTTVMRCKCMGKAKKAEIILELASCIVRLQLHTTYPEEFASMKSTIDDVLKASFIADKLIGVGEMMWLKTHKAVCELVMEKDDLENILSCAGNFKSVKPEITRLYRNSKLGERVLHFATSLVGSSDIGDLITEALADASSSHFTVESVGRYMSKTDLELIKYKKNFRKYCV